jgi:hypothetical protein
MGLPLPLTRSTNANRPRQTLPATFNAGSDSSRSSCATSAVTASSGRLSIQTLRAQMLNSERRTGSTGGSGSSLSSSETTTPGNSDYSDYPDRLCESNGSSYSERFTVESWETSTRSMLSNQWQGQSHSGVRVAPLRSSTPLTSIVPRHSRSASLSTGQSNPFLSGYDNTPQLAVIPGQRQAPMSNYDDWRYSTRPGSPACSSDTTMSGIAGVEYGFVDPSFDLTLNATATPQPCLPSGKRIDLRRLDTPLECTPGPDPLANWDTPQMNTLARGPVQRKAPRKITARGI